HGGSSHAFRVRWARSGVRPNPDGTGSGLCAVGPTDWGECLEGLAGISGERVVAARPFVSQAAGIADRSAMRAGCDSGGFADVEARMAAAFDIVTDPGFLHDMHGVLHISINSPSMRRGVLTRAEDGVQQGGHSNGLGFPRGIGAGA